MKRYSIILVTVVLLVAACGGTSTETTEAGAAAAAATESDQSESTTAGAPTDTAAASGSVSIEDIDLGEDGELSLDDFVPGMRGPQDEADFRAQEMEVQQQIAECMAAEGFEYIPFVPSDVGGGFEFDETDHEEYVKEYGFGVSTWVLMEEQFAYDEESDPWADDPNQEIVEAMDEFELEEYYRVLHGGEPDIIANTPQEEIEAMTPEEQEQFFNEAYANWVPDGCYNEAYEELYGGGEADMAFWEEFGDDFEEVYTRAQADPRIVAAQADWSACMAEKGHDYADQEEMYAYFYGDEFGEGEFSKRVNELITWPEPDPGLFEDLAEGEEPVFEDDPSLWAPQYDIEQLQPLIDEEIAVATADLECSKDLQELLETVYKETEQQFLEENLERLLAFMEEHS